MKNLQNLSSADVSYIAKYNSMHGVVVSLLYVFSLHVTRCRVLVEFFGIFRTVLVSTPGNDLHILGCFSKKTRVKETPA